MSGENKGPIQSVRFISRGGTALAAVMMLSLAVAAAFAQSYVPPTAREAASLPAFASRLAHRAAHGGPGNAYPQHRRASPQDYLYANGPVNGICDLQGCTVDAWDINFGFTVTNTIGSNGTDGGFSFAVWLFPGDTLSAVDWSFGTSHSVLTWHRERHRAPV